MNSPIEKVVVKKADIEADVSGGSSGSGGGGDVVYSPWKRITMACVIILFVPTALTLSIWAVYRNISNIASKPSGE